VSDYRSLGLTLLAVVLLASNASNAQTTLEKSAQSAIDNRTVVASVQAQRDRYWDDIAAQIPIGGAVPSGCGDYDMGWEPSDISAHVSNRVILTVTVTTIRSILSASKLSRYVETTLQVHEVFQDLSSSGNLHPHKNISLLFYGGHGADYPPAKDLSPAIDKDKCDDALKVGRDYLVVLSYMSNGDFYELYDSWDISDGTVRANGARNRYVVADGNSVLNGVNSKQLGPVLDKLLYGTN
jgi:hypothetical protein